MKKMRNKIFWVRLKPYEPGFPNYKFKPAVIKGIVYAPNAESAKKMAYDDYIGIVRALFPTADLKALECKNLNADFSISAKV